MNEQIEQISQATREARLNALEAAKHSAEMEGGHVPEPAEAVVREYAEGRITLREAEERMTARYGAGARV